MRKAIKNNHFGSGRAAGMKVLALPGIARTLRNAIAQGRRRQAGERARTIPHPRVFNSRRRRHGGQATQR